MDMEAVIALQALEEPEGATVGAAVTGLGSFISIFSECSSGCQWPTYPMP